MAFSRSVAITATAEHTTASDGTFSAAGATAWNGTSAHNVAASGTGSVVDAVSGGIPFFSSTTAEGTSALLASGGVVLGGGAGAAPFTDAGLTYSTTTDVFQANGIIASSLNGTIAFSANAGNSVGFGRNDSIGNLQFYGGGVTPTSSNAQGALTTGAVWVATSGGGFGISSSANAGNPAIDIALNRVGAGVLGVHTATGAGSSGSVRAKFQSSDGTAGATAGPFTVITSITVKDGIVTALTGS